MKEQESMAMHQVNIPKHVRQRVIRRQGRWNVHDEVPPEQSALVVVDMQNYFMAPGQLLETPPAREIVPNVNRLADALRRAGGKVIWIQTVFDPECAADWSHFHEIMNVPERAKIRSESLARGAYGAELWHELDVRPEDRIVEKTRYSALIEGASDLLTILRENGITAVWVAGTATGTCCESTARDAMLLNFRTTMVTDANADVSDEDHLRSLISFTINFGDLSSTDQLIARLQGNSAKIGSPA